jgi:Rad3-related DNA helicase
LQEQYKHDFPYLANVSAKQNYVCMHRIGGLTCDFGLTIQRVLMGEKFKDYYSNCVYVRAKRAFDTSDIGVTNLHYFLNHARPDRQDIKDRMLLVIDEAHNLENTVIDFASLEFTKYRTKEILKLDWPKVIHMNIAQFMEWVSGTYYAKLQDEAGVIKNRLESSQSETFLTSKSGLSLMKKQDELGRQINSLDACLNIFKEDEWVMSVSSAQDIVDIKPLYAKNYTQPSLFSFARKVLMMSGTILDKKTYCHNVGIPEADTEFLSLDSPFDIKNRPIFSVKAGSLSKTNIKQNLPNIIHVIEQLLDEHKAEKGIIHCNSYEIAKYIDTHIRSKRLLFHSSDDRQDILNLHLISKDPTVLVSPSFTEGIDLVGDLSRFQIIVKMPFPYLGDNYVRTKMDKIPNWYNWMTAKTLIQSSGRSIRDVNDWAVSYILDSDFEWFFKRNNKLFPHWWTKALQK